MLLSTAIGCFLIAWTSLFLVDYILRVRAFAPYVNFATKHGLEVSLFQVRIYTTRHDDGPLPAPSQKPSIVRRTLVSLWFALGVVMALAASIFICVYLTRMLAKDISMLSTLRPARTPYRYVPSEVRQQLPPTTTVASNVVDSDPAAPVHYDVIDDGQRANSGLVPIIPGFNLPLAHIPIFMFVLIVVTYFHEIGHAAAARNVDVIVNGFGVFLFVLYPGAFTDLEPQSLKRVSVGRRLMIYSGGIWHNLVLAGFAYLLFLSTPTMLTPLFAHGDGVTVVSVDERSGLFGPSGLEYGNVVEAIDDCPVKLESDWLQCVRTLKRQHNGRCVEETLVARMQTEQVTVAHDEVHCCASFTNITHAHLCFESLVILESEIRSSKAPSLNRLLVVNKPAAAKENSNDIVQKREQWARRFSCMSARHVTNRVLCNDTTPCTDSSDTCVYPALYNGTQLARITVRDLDRAVLYVGNLDELITFVSIEPWVARFDLIGVSWAEALQLATKYLFTLSLALAVLNAVPCYALDGQFIVTTLVGFILRHSVKRRRKQACSIILVLGSFLLGANIFLGFLKLLL